MGKTGRTLDSPSPVLRWAGSKRLLLPKLLQLAPVHFETYIEPFCGSACFFLALAPDSAVLSDLNPQLIATYSAIKDNSRIVAEHLGQWSTSKRQYLRLRSHVPSHRLLAASRFVYLNRLSFNGVYRENLKGEFNVPYGGTRNGTMPDRSALASFSKALKGAKLLCSDFERIVDRACAGDFVYLDPPYHYGNARNRGEYGVGAFSHDDIDRLINAVHRADKRGVSILLSYNKAHMLARRLKGWSLSYAETRRSVAGFANNRKTVREYFLRNYFS
jgi:DNA adenine methylase